MMAVDSIHVNYRVLCTHIHTRKILLKSQKNMHPTLHPELVKFVRDLLWWQQPFSSMKGHAGGERAIKQGKVPPLSPLPLTLFFFRVFRAREAFSGCGGLPPLSRRRSGRVVLWR